jgi:hypothetical protein
LLAALAEHDAAKRRVEGEVDDVLARFDAEGQFRQEPSEN